MLNTLCEMIIQHVHLPIRIYAIDVKNRIFTIIPLMNDSQVQMVTFVDGNNSI